jgi:hypothetical protein
MIIQIETSTVAKAGGWLFFVSTFISQYISGGVLPHNVPGWLQLLGALFLAAGVHAAATSGGTTTPSAVTAPPQVAK